MPQISDETQTLAAEAERRGLLSPGLRQAFQQQRKQVPGTAPEQRVVAPPSPAQATEPLAARVAPGVKPAAVTAGALTGAEIGSPLGPLGVLGGGVLGAGAVAAGWDNIRNALISAGILKGDPQKADEVAKDAVGQMTMEAAGGGAFPVAGRLAKIAKARLGGVDEAASRAADIAKQLGINLGIVDVGKSPLPKGYEMVAGRFPYVGSPFRKAMQRKAGEVEQAAKGLISDIGDVQPVAEMGEQLTGAAKKSFAEFKAARDSRYNSWRDMADNLDAQIPTANLQKSAADYVTAYDAERAVYGKTQQATLDPSKEPPFIERARKIATIQPTLSPKQYEAVLRDFDTDLARSQNEGFQFKNVDQVRRAAKADFDNIQIPGATGGLVPAPALAQTRRAIDEWFHGALAKFETPTAKVFGRVDKKMFDVGFEEAGTRNADEMLTLAFSKKSPQAMKDLRALVGEKAFRNAVATKLHDVYDGAMQDMIIGGKMTKVPNIAKFRETLGLGKPKSPEYATLVEGLKQSGTGVTVKQLEDFADAAEAAIGRGSPEASTFLARRAVMGGAGAIETALPLGAALHYMSIWPLALIAAARKGSSFFADPRKLEEVTALVNPRTPEQYKEQIAKRVLRGLGVGGTLSAVEAKAQAGGQGR